jgi:hypothetical protein
MEHNAYPPPKARLADPEGPTSQLTVRKVLPIWWSFTWRSLIYGALGALVFFFITSALVGGLGHREKMVFYGSVVSACVWLLLSVVALQQALKVRRVGPPER